MMPSIQPIPVTTTPIDTCGHSHNSISPTTDNMQASVAANITVAVQSSLTGSVPYSQPSGNTFEPLENEREIARFAKIQLQGTTVRSHDVRERLTHIANGGAVDSENQDGSTALICASMVGLADLVEALLNADANVNHTNKMGRTALFGATCWGHIDILRKLINAGAELEIADKYGMNAMMVASHPRCVSSSDFLAVLLYAGANANTVNKRLSCFYVSPLGHAVQLLDFRSYKDTALDRVKALLKAGADENQPNGVGDTPLSTLEAILSKNELDSVLALKKNARPRECISLKEQCRKRVRKFITKWSYYNKLPLPKLLIEYVKNIFDKDITINSKNLSR